MNLFVYFFSFKKKKLFSLILDLKLYNPPAKAFAKVPFLFFNCLYRDKVALCHFSFSLKGEKNIEIKKISWYWKFRKKKSSWLKKFEADGQYLVPLVKYSKLMYLPLSILKLKLLFLPSLSLSELFLFARGNQEENSCDTFWKMELELHLLHAFSSCPLFFHFTLPFFTVDLVKIKDMRLPTTYFKEEKMSGIFSKTLASCKKDINLLTEFMSFFKIFIYLKFEFKGCFCLRSSNSAYEIVFYCKIRVTSTTYFYDGPSSVHHV